MYFRQLRYFTTVARAGSFAAAARVLHVSQPALGQQVKALEEHLGVQLLDRHSRGVGLSEAGEIFIERAEALLRGAHDAYQALERFRGEAVVTVAIGVTPTPGRSLVPRLLAECSLIPQLSLWVRPGLSDELLRQVTAGDLDLALCYEAASNDRLEAFPLYEEDLFLVGSPTLLGGGGDLPFAALTDYPLVLDYRYQASRQQVERLAQEHGVALKVFHEVEPTNLKRELLLHHGRCSIVPYALFLDEIQDGQLAARRIVGPTVSRALFLVARRDFSRETTERLLAIFRQIVADLAARGGLGWRLVPGVAEAGSL